MELHKKGFIVYGGARRVERMKELEVHGIKTLPLDVTDEQSIKRTIDLIIKEEGQIDILINNAGYGSYGALEDVSMDEARKQFDVNLFGLARITQLVMPYMRENNYGKIINISSIGGKINVPYGTWYHATKYALEGFSDCLRLEASQFGIDVILIEPGLIKTDWGLIAADMLSKASENSAYKEGAIRVANGMRDRYANRDFSGPEVVAHGILKAINARKPKTRYSMGHMAKTILCLRRMLSDRLFDKLIVKTQNM